ncbi:MAG: hypothetical protein U1F43_11640 [Myxococcota bacterium]
MPAQTLRRTRLVLALTALGASLPACGASDAPGGALPDRCQKLVARLTTCAEKLPADARAPLLQVMKAQSARWQDAAKKGGDAARALDAGCRDAIDDVKAATRTTCPDVVWE